MEREICVQVYEDVNEFRYLVHSRSTVGYNAKDLYEQICIHWVDLYVKIYKNLEDRYHLMIISSNLYL